VELRERQTRPTKPAGAANTQELNRNRYHAAPEGGKQMSELTSPVCRARTFLLTLGLAALIASAVQAQTPYKIQPLVKLGDRVGDPSIAPTGGFRIGSLNDNGQLVFVTQNAAGGQALIQHGDGKFTPIIAAGKEAAGSTWPADVGVSSPVSMNQSGDVTFHSAATIDGQRVDGVFLWDNQAKQVALIARPGTSTVNDQVLVAFFHSPVINNKGEVAFVADVKDAGEQPPWGVFFRGRDGRLLPVASHSRPLPGGDSVRWAFFPTLNDAGTVGFLALRRLGSEAAYTWQKETISPLGLAEGNRPGALFLFEGVWVNNQNESVLVRGLVGGERGDRDSLYRFAGGKLTPLVAQGQEMPGGGKLESLQIAAHYVEWDTVSFASEMGQHAFLATLEDGSSAAYRLDADGKLSLILKSGTTTELGKITRVGGTPTPQGLMGSHGIGLNRKGQVAVSVQIDNGPDTLVLLTPPTP
jgi:hypothetical protein